MGLVFWIATVREATGVVDRGDHIHEGPSGRSLCFRDAKMTQVYSLIPLTE